MKDLKILVIVLVVIYEIRYDFVESGYYLLDKNRVSTHFLDKFFDCQNLDAKTSKSVIVIIFCAKDTKVNDVTQSNIKFELERWEHLEEELIDWFLQELHHVISFIE